MSVYSIFKIRGVVKVENVYHSASPDMGAMITMVRNTTKAGMIVDHICIMDLDSQYESNIYIQVCNGYNLFLYAEVNIGGAVSEYHGDDIPNDILNTYLEIHESILGKIG